MKKLFLLLVTGVLFMSAGYAQVPVSYRGKILDTTVTNAGAPVITQVVTGGKKMVTFQYNITKTSGTVAGTIVLQGSVDGVKYFTLNTYTLTDATATTAVSYSYNGYAKYKVTVNQTGTSVANYQIWSLWYQ